MSHSKRRKTLRSRRVSRAPAHGTRYTPERSVRPRLASLDYETDDFAGYSRRFFFHTVFNKCKSNTKHFSGKTLLIRILFYFYFFRSAGESENTHFLRKIKTHHFISIREKLPWKYKTNMSILITDKIDLIVIISTCLWQRNYLLSVKK